MKITIPILLISLLVINCNDLLNEVNYRTEVSLDPGVLQQGEIYYSIYPVNPISYPEIGPLESGIIGNSEDAPLQFLTPSLTQNDTFYLVVFMDVDQNQEWTFMNNVPVEPYGGYGVRKSTPELVALVASPDLGYTLPDLIIYHPGDLLENPVKFQINGTITFDEALEDTSPVNIMGVAGDWYWGSTTYTIATDTVLPAWGNTLNFSLNTTYYYLQLYLLAYIDEDNNQEVTFDNRPESKIYLEPFGGYGIDFSTGNEQPHTILIDSSKSNLDFIVYSEYRQADFKNLAFLGGNITYEIDSVRGQLIIALLDSAMEFDRPASMSINQLWRGDPVDSYRLLPVERGTSFYLSAFLDLNGNDSLDVDLLGLSLEPMGAWGINPNYYDFELNRINVNGHRLNLNLRIMDVDSLYRMGSASISGTVTLYDTLTADSGYICVFLSNPLDEELLTYIQLPIYFQNGSAPFQLPPLWAMNQTYYLAAYLDENHNFILDRDSDHQPLEPFGGYGTSPNNPSVQPLQLDTPQTIMDLEITIYPVNIFP